ncbi:YVTN repeat-like/Quino protein amine dehydrogenase [Thermothelomyces heterothallicus CBS 203.75]
MATELPPRFTADLEQSLEQSLEVPGPAMPTDQQSTTSSARQRRWDDPQRRSRRAGALRPYLETEIMQLAFSPAGSHLIAMAPKAVNSRAFSRQGVFGLLVWNATTGQRLQDPVGSGGSSHGIRLNGGFALKPASASAPEPLVVACPFLLPSTSPYDSNGTLMGRLEFYDLARRERLAKQDAPVCAPVAWSADGVLLAGVSMLEPSRVVVVQVPRARETYLRVVSVLMHHQAEVTQLAFLPVSEQGGRALVSAGRDGFVRVTSVTTGRTLDKIEIGARAPAKLLQVSGDGKLVVTVWGRDVVLWFLDSGRVHNYNLDAVRLGEGWPLAISPDCRYLACRNEEGFDVMDVQTGKFRGEFPWTGPTITAAAFNSDGTKLAIGDYYGNLQIFDVVTG